MITTDQIMTEHLAFLSADLIGQYGPRLDSIEADITDLAAREHMFDITLGSEIPGNWTRVEDFRISSAEIEAFATMIRYLLNLPAGTYWPEERGELYAIAAAELAAIEERGQRFELDAEEFLP